MIGAWGCWEHSGPCNFFFFIFMEIRQIWSLNLYTNTNIISYGFFNQFSPGFFFIIQCRTSAAVSPHFTSFAQPVKGHICLVRSHSILSCSNDLIWLDRPCLCFWRADSLFTLFHSCLQDKNSSVEILIVNF